MQKWRGLIEVGRPIDQRQRDEQLSSVALSVAVGLHNMLLGTKMLVVILGNVQGMACDCCFVLCADNLECFE